MQILKYIFIGLLIFLTCGCGGKKKQGELLCIIWELI